MYPIFEWAAPERRCADRVLSTIPNEIYFHVLEHVVPPFGALTPEELRLFANLSPVCKLFANVCLPRMFEFLEFSDSLLPGTTSTDSSDCVLVRPSREDVLCTQIAEKQPIALALAKAVRVCHFSHWNVHEPSSSEVRSLAEKYLAGLLHMSNIREVKFSDSFVDIEHWNAIATLGSLEELTLDWCNFQQTPADVGWLKVQTSRLRMLNCNNQCTTTQPVDAVVSINPRNLRALVMDLTLFDRVDWLSHSILTELCIQLYRPSNLTQDEYMDRLHAILVQLPRSLEALCLVNGVRVGPARDLVRRMLRDPAWTNLPLLRSLTLRVSTEDSESPVDVLSAALQGVGLLTELQTLSLEGYSVTFTEAQHGLHDKLSPGTRLNYVDIYGRILRLVDGEWSKASAEKRIVRSIKHWGGSKDSGR